METIANIGENFRLHPSYKGVTDQFQQPPLVDKNVQKAFKHGSVQKAIAKKAKRQVSQRYSQRQFLKVATGYSSPDEIKLDFRLTLLKK